MPAKIIAVWFFKGGVGKTTTSVNVAAELARQGYRTAILDFDGQCNVTQMLVPPQTDASSGDEGDGESEDDIEFVEDRIVEGEPPIFHDEPKNVNPDWIDNYQQLIVSNAYTALAPYIGGLGGAPSLDLVPIANTAFGNRLLLLPGSHKLFEHDSKLAKAEIDELGSINVLGGFREYCRLLEAEHKLDFIVVDLSPGASAMARTIILSADYLLPPLASDYFCFCSAQAMVYEVLPKWLVWHDRLVERQVELSAGLDRGTAARLPWFKSDRVKILPFLVSGYNVWKAGGGKRAMEDPANHSQSLTKADSQWVQALTRVFDDEGEKPIPPQVWELLVANTGRDGVPRIIIAFLKDIGAICQFSQVTHTPIPAMNMVQVKDTMKLMGWPMGGHEYDTHVKQLKHAQLKLESLGKWLVWLRDFHAQAAAADGNGGGPAGGGGRGGNDGDTADSGSSGPRNNAVNFRATTATSSYHTARSRLS